jgi:membrane-associated phospholipid phosphatase
LLQQLLEWDFRAFEAIHIGNANRVFDALLPFVRNPFFWAPLYLFLLAYMYREYGKKGLNWVLFFFFCFVAGDFLSARVLKPLFHRTRPCIDSYWMEIHRHIVPDSVGYSFPSSHATNHFAMAIFIVLTIPHLQRTYKLLAIFWAALIAYSQVYVGVHYPLDVTAGALLGIWIGYVIGNYFNFKTQLL